MTATIIADNSKDKSENRISYLIDYWTEFKANKEMNFIIADNLTDQQAKEFLIRDNVSTGSWDMDILANNWDSEELNDWGVNVWIPEEEESFGDKNKELGLDDLNDKCFFKLEYSQDDYELLKARLSTIGKTPEAVFYDALV